MAHVWLPFWTQIRPPLGQKGAFMSGETVMGMARARKRDELIRHPCAQGAISLVLLMAVSTPVFAQSTCETDMKRIKDKHDAVVASLNAMKKSGKLDAEAACPKLRVLAGVENEWIAYMTKNKDWCSIPDDALTNMEGNKNKTAAFATQACSVAAKNKKMKEQQAAGGGAGQQPQVRLPTGPL
jgi:hypothetical protein